MDFLFVFDIGGVVVRNFSIWERIQQKMGLDTSETVNGYPKKGTPLYEKLQNVQRGSESGMQFLKDMAQEHGLPTPPENYWKTFFAPTIDTETDDFLQKLQQKKFRIVAGTNTMDVHYEYHIEHNDYIRFDEVYASHLMHEVKPEAGFWKYILEKENEIRKQAGKSLFTFEQMIFFDDVEDNIVAASELGIKAFVFTDAHKAINDIKEYVQLD